MTKEVLPTAFTVDLILSKIVFSLLVLSVWFSALAKAGHDLWASSVIFFLLTVASCIELLRNRINTSLFRQPLFLSLLFVLISIWASIPHSFDVFNSLHEAVIFSGCVLFFFIFLNHFDTKIAVFSFFRYASLVLIPICGVALWQQFVSRSPDSFGRWEIPSTMINSNSLAGFLLPFGPLLVSQAKQSWMSRLLLFPWVILILLSRSWWAYIALALGMGVYFRTSVARWADTNRRLALTTGLILGLMFAGVLLFKLQDVMGPYLGTSRFYWWTAGTSLFLANPWFGIGLGGFGSALPLTTSFSAHNSLFIHSFPLQLCVELGLVGLTAIVAFSAALYKQYVLVAVMHQKDKNVYIAALASTLIYSLLTIHLEYFANKLILFALLGAIVFDPNQKPRTRLNWTWVLLSITIFLSLVPNWSRLLLASQSYEHGIVVTTSTSNTNIAVTHWQTAIDMVPFHGASHWMLTQHYAKEYTHRYNPLDFCLALHHGSRSIQYKPIYAEASLWKSLQQLEEKSYLNFSVCRNAL